MMFCSCKTELPCEHIYTDGICQNCGAACIHSYENGSCSICEMSCAHSYESGVCSICTIECAHSYENGSCSICSVACSHNTYKYGDCLDCGYKCNPHKFQNGYCSFCRVIQLTENILAGKKYTYSHFEVAWSKNATDKQKEILRNQFGLDSDKDLFVEISKELRPWLHLADFFRFTLDGTEVFDGFNDVYGDNSYSISTSTNTITTNIGWDKLYFTGDCLYLLENAPTPYNGIQIKVIYLPKT